MRRAPWPRCLRSIARCDYPNELITVICANNQSTDDSWRVYQTMQKELRDLRLQWLEGPQRGQGPGVEHGDLCQQRGTTWSRWTVPGCVGQTRLKEFHSQLYAGSAVQAQTGAVLCNRKLIEADRHHRWMHHSEYLAHRLPFWRGGRLNRKPTS